MIDLANPQGIADVVAQQFEVARQVLGHGMVPIIEPEVSIKSPERDAADRILLREILKNLDAIPDGQQVMLKLSIPAEPGLFEPLVRPSEGAAGRGAVGRLLARGGLPRARQEPRHDRQLQPRACSRTFGTARATRSSTARSATAIDEIYEASTEKVPA